MTSLLNRRSFIGAAIASVVGLAGLGLGHAPQQPHFLGALVFINPENSGKLMYLDSGDFVRPGEWFAVPLRCTSDKWVEYPV